MNYIQYTNFEHRSPTSVKTDLQHPTHGIDASGSGMALGPKTKGSSVKIISPGDKSRAATRYLPSSSD